MSTTNHGSSEGDIMATQAAVQASRGYPENRSMRGTTYGRAGAALRQEPLTEVRFVVGISSIGLVLVARGERGVAAVLIGDDRDALRRDLQLRFPEAVLSDGDAELHAVAARVIRLIESPAEGTETGGIDLPIDPRGTEFQQMVWRALREIPAGSTATYAEIAERIGFPKSARAVARACAANPLAVVIPCHRVVRSDGELSGYRWGTERKRALLERERGL